jgi:hypothetical protein
MAKALLMSILAAALAFPISAARDPRPLRGMKRAAVSFVIFVVVWAYALVHVLPYLKD